MNAKYKKVWMVFSEHAAKGRGGDGWLTWAECRRVGHTRAHTVSAHTAQHAALSARENGFPDATCRLVTVKSS